MFFIMSTRGVKIIDVVFSVEEMLKEPSISDVIEINIVAQPCKCLWNNKAGKMYEESIDVLDIWQNQN